VRQRRPRARAKQIKNRHLAVYMYAKQLGLLADVLLMDGTNASVRAMLACLRDIEPLLEELLGGGKSLQYDGKVMSFRRHQLRREVNSALGVLKPWPRPPGRAA
jgi:hypothetical protein